MVRLDTQKNIYIENSLKKGRTAVFEIRTHDVVNTR